MRQFRVRESVVVGAGNIGDRIVRARRKIKNLCRNSGGPFVAAILPSGNVPSGNVVPRSLDDHGGEE
jgi:hypothetical protein